METIGERIQYLIDQYYEGNTSKYCRAIKVKQPTMNDIIGGKKINPSYQTLIKIITDNSVHIDVYWLLLGIGNHVKNVNTDGDCPCCERLKEENANLTRQLNEQLILTQNILLGKTDRPLIEKRSRTG